MKHSVTALCTYFQLKEEKCAPLKMELPAATTTLITPVMWRAMQWTNVESSSELERKKKMCNPLVNWSALR